MHPSSITVETIVVPTSEPLADASRPIATTGSPSTAWWLPESASAQVYDIDFFGALVSANLDGFEASSGGVFRGGPNSDLRVGPATLVLDDGTVIDIAPDTPGGNMCRPFGGYTGDVNEQTCFVVGAFQSNTNEAAWFATMPSFGAYLDVVGFRDRAAQIPLEDRTRFELPIRTDARLNGCPDGDLSATPMMVPNAPAFNATMNIDDEVVLIECGADA